MLHPPALNENSCSDEIRHLKMRSPSCPLWITTTTAAAAALYRRTTEVISIGLVYLLFARVLAWDSGSVVKTLSGAPTIWLSFIFSMTV